jgi:CheY-like chemotaxis protein
VLVVEDLAEQRQSLWATLSGAGYRVDAVATAAEALAHAAARRYDAITLDLLLPDEDGREVLATLRGRGPNVDTPVIVVSVLTEGGFLPGFHVHQILAKPVAGEDLAKWVAGLGVPPAGRPILLVGDDAMAQRQAEMALAPAGYRLVCCAGSAAAVEAVERETPAAMFLDLDMPGGVQLVEELRRRPVSRAVPVVLGTGLELPAEKRARLLARAQELVPKSAGTRALLERLAVYVPAPAGAERPSQA